MIYKNVMVAIACVVSAFYSLAGLSQTPEQAVNAVIQNTHGVNLNNVNFGIAVMSMTTGKMVYKYNIDRLYTPASVQKLFTASAALAYLKPGYRFKTGFFTNGLVRNYELDGDLYVHFSGDPSLKLANLAQMMDELHSMHVNRIQGHVYIDNFDFDRVPYPPGWIWDDLSYSYAAPMDAIILDRNKFALRFTPTQLGQSPGLSSNLPNGVADFVNRMRTMDSYREDCPITIYSTQHNEYQVAGCLDQHWGAQSRSLAVRDMVRYAEVEVASLLQARGITYLGSVTLQKMPANSTPLVVHASQPLSQLVRYMLKKSDNLYTNALFKKIGEEYSGESGSWQNGLQALKHILGPTANIDFKANLLTDGAGLSRYNLISPHQFISLLNFVYHNASIKTPLLEALPVSGRDGTLQGRMIDEDYAGRVHAKTGSMTGVTALAGYVVAQHDTFAFAILINDFVGKKSPYMHVEDRVCEALVKI